MKYYKLLYDYEHEDNSIFLEIDEKTLSFDRYEAEKGIEFCDWNVDIKVNYDKCRSHRFDCGLSSKLF